MLADAVFYLLAALIIVAALGVVALRNIFHAALAFGLMLVGIAGLYLVLSAEFIAVTQLLIYVGAIMTLILFAVMLTQRIADPSVPHLNEQRGPAALIAVGLGVLLITVILQTPWSRVSRPGPLVGVTELGRQLLTTYVLPFEVISIALVAALVGAMVIAKREQSTR